VVLVVTGAWGGSTTDPMERLGATLNFAPRISAPTLMVYSTHDGVEQGQELYDHLAQPKEIVWHDIEDHVILVDDQKPEVLRWLDRYLH
jgi:esterase/lipase